MKILAAVLSLTILAGRSLGYRSLGAPAKFFNSLIDVSSINTRFRGPCTDSFGFAKSGQPNIIATIILLFGWRGPSAIFWTIANASVNPVNTMRLCRPFSHISKKSLKRLCPPFANVNVSVGWADFCAAASCVRTTFFYSAPYTVFVRLTHSVSFKSVGRYFTADTAARFCAPRFNMVNPCLNRISAITNAISHPSVAATSYTLNCESSESLRGFHV